MLLQDYILSQVYKLSQGNILSKIIHFTQGYMYYYYDIYHHKDTCYHKDTY